MINRGLAYHTALAEAGIAIDGIAINKGEIRIDFKEEATDEARQLAEEIVTEVTEALSAQEDDEE